MGARRGKFFGVHGIVHHGNLVGMPQAFLKVLGHRPGVGDNGGGPPVSQEAGIAAGPEIPEVPDDAPLDPGCEQCSQDMTLDAVGVDDLGGEMVYSAPEPGGITEARE